MGRKKQGRLYTRVRGGEARYYADFRDFADVGGRQEALIAPGDRAATTDPVIAQKLLSDRLAELQALKRGKVLYGIERTARLAEYASYHLVEKARSGRISDTWLVNCERHLKEAVAFFGAGRELSTISTRDVQRYLVHLGRREGGRGGTTISAGTQRQYLNALSNLFRRAVSEGCVPPGYNPVAAMMDKPVARRREAEWLEVHDAALLLEAARHHRPPPDKHAIPFMHALLTTFLLTGGRKSEVLGLKVEDISFDRQTITFRPNEYRRLKTATSHRTLYLCDVANLVGGFGDWQASGLEIEYTAGHPEALQRP